MIYDRLISNEQLDSIGVNDSEAANLYIFCVLHSIDPNLVNITNKDKNLLTKYNIVTRKVTADGIVFTINIKSKEESIEISMNNVEDDINSNINEYRKLFTLTRRPDAIGVKASVKANLLAFFKKYPQYNMKEVIEATALYLKSFSPEQLKYARRADYFIYKQSAPGGVKVSTLADVLENMDGYKTKSISWNQMI